MRLVPEELRAVLHAQIRIFHRQKALEPEGFRWGVVSMDGKATTIRAWDKRFVQRQGSRGAIRNCHHTFDAALAEDERPWFREHTVGAFYVILLRRLAYNAMALFRARTLRAEANRLMPWRHLALQVFIALINATEEAVNGLRARAPP